MDILLSVRKEYLDKILSGEKTLDIRKTPRNSIPAGFGFMNPEGEMERSASSAPVG